MSRKEQIMVLQSHPNYKLHRQVYDIVYTHLLKQGHKAITPREEGTPVCSYLAEDGVSQCAVGCLIPKEYYSDVIEGALPEEWYNEEPEDYEGRENAYYLSATLKQIFGDAYDHQLIKLLRRLQDIHDDTEPSQWRTQLFELGGEWGFHDNLWRARQDA